MQPNKSKKNLSDIAKFCHNNDFLTKTFHDLLKGINLSYINSILNKCKSKGVSSSNIFQTIFLFQYLDLNNVHQFIRSKKSKSVDFQKDVLYEFLKNPLIDWRNILHLFRIQVFKLIKKKECYLGKREQ